MSAHKTKYWAVPATLFLILCQLTFCWKSLPHSLGGDVDFRVFYSSGHMVAAGSGDRLYDYDTQTEMQRKLVSRSGQTLPFLYPAFAAFLFLPFSYFPYKVAFLLFGLTNLCLLGIAGVWMRQHLPLLQKSPPWFPGYLSLAFFPVSVALMQGQLSFLLLLLYTLCFSLHRKHREFSSGLLLAGTLVKFQFALPVALLFLVWRQWRTIAGFALGAIILATVSIAITGPHGAAQYIDGLLDITHAGLQNPYAARVRYGMFPGDMPNLRGFFFLIMQGSWTGQALALLCSLGLMTWATRQRPTFAIALPAAIMVSYHMQAYDLTLLLLPLAIEIDRRQATTGKRASRKSSISLALLIVPAAPFLLVNGMCGLFAISTFAILCSASCHQSDRGDLAPTGPLEVTAPQLC